MKKGKLAFILFLIGIGLFVFALHSTNLSEVSFALSKLWPLKFFLIFLILFLGEIIVGSLRWSFILKTQSQQPEFKKIFWAKLAGFSFSYLTPVVFFGGEPVRYVLLKEENSKIPAKYIISSIIIDKLMFFSASTISFFIGLFFFLIHIQASFETKIFVFGLLILGVLIALFLYLRFKKIIEKEGIFSWLIRKLYLSKVKSIKEKESKIREIEKEMAKFLKAKRASLIKVFLGAGIEVLFLIFSFWFIIYSIGKYLDIGKIFAINSMTGLSSIIPLPAALGSLEMGQSFLFKILGLGKETGIAFSLIFRGINLLIAFLGLISFLYFQIKFSKKRILNFFQKLSRLYEK
jgi:uncharacterized protein (TIRG00374 family)